MRIGVDIDDTLTDTSLLMREYVLRENNKFLEDNLYKIIRGNFDSDEIVEFANKYLVEIIENVKIKNGAKEVIDKLRSEGYEIYFITARSDNYFGNVYEKVSNFLDKNNIKYDGLICGQHYKVNACLDNNIIVMFDDAIDTCESVCEVGVKGVVFTSDLNDAINTACDRVSTWDELYNYVKLLK